MKNGDIQLNYVDFHFVPRIAMFGRSLFLATAGLCHIILIQLAQTMNFRLI